MSTRPRDFPLRSLRTPGVYAVWPHKLIPAETGRVSWNRKAAGSGDSRESWDWNSLESGAPIKGVFMWSWGALVASLSSISRESTTPDLWRKCLCCRYWT